MRDTTMRDKLSAVLGVPKPRRPIAVQSDESLIRTAQKKAKVMNRSMKTVSPPRVSEPRRYKTPPKRDNPFKYHVYSQEETPEELPSSETVEQSPSIDEPVAAESETQPKIPAPAVQQLATVLEFSPSGEIQPSEGVIEGAIEEAKRVSEITQSPVEAETETPSADAAEVPPELISQPKEPEKPVIVVPPNLTWLQQPTPFGDELQHIVGRVRNAKANISFTLEQSLLRQKKLRAEHAEIEEKLAREELVGEEQRIKLRQLDDMISACALVAEQSMSIDATMFPARGAAAKKHPEKEQLAHVGNGKPFIESAYQRRWSKDDPTMCRKEDIIKFFAEHPNENWRAPQIRELLPEEKQAHAREYLSKLLTDMHHDGRLQKVDTGVYRAVPAS